MNPTGYYSFLRYGSLTLLLASIFLLSCHKQDMHDDNFLSLDKASVRLDTLAGSSENITVKPSVPWAAVVAPGATAWLQLDKTSGGPGNTVIKLTGTHNNGMATPQTGAVTFSPANSSTLRPVTLAVTQKPYSFSIGYSKTLGGTDFESTRSVNTPDGGSIMVGATSSVDGDVHGSHGKQDAWIVKLNSAGDTVWTRTLGGTGDDVASAVILTAEGKDFWWHVRRGRYFSCCSA